MWAPPGAGAPPTRIPVTELAPVSHAASSTVLAAKDGETKLELDLDSNRTPLEPDVDLVHLDPEDVAIARKRYEAIGLLTARLQAGLMLSRADVADVAIAANVHTATIYRWLRRYCGTERLSALIPSRPDGGRGRARLSEDAEDILIDVIESVYLSTESMLKRPPLVDVYDALVLRCQRAGVQPPSARTLARRIDRILAEREFELRKRRGRQRVAAEARARDSVAAIGAVAPLAVVQIDHTKLDAEIVSEIDREPIGRPWLTLVIDVYTRMILGFFVSLEPPGAMSVGLRSEERRGGKQCR